jgi:hypothetical protein
MGTHYINQGSTFSIQKISIEYPGQVELNTWALAEMSSIPHILEARAGRRIRPIIGAVA